MLAEDEYVDADGIMDLRSQTIGVRDGSSKAYSQDTLLHETIHAIDESLGLKMTENKFINWHVGFLQCLKTMKSFQNGYYKMNDEIKSPSIWFIHGANATPLSFKSIQLKLRESDSIQEHQFINVKYDCQDPLSEIVERIVSVLPDDVPIFLVGHSLGGVIAAAVAQKNIHFEYGKDIKGVITIASPLGGCEGADYLQWLFPHYHLFKNISTKNKVVMDLKANGAAVPTLSFITTSGNNPVYPEANDGVVTVNSQRALRNAKKIEVPYNHFEVLLSEDVAEHIKTFVLEDTSVSSTEIKL